MSVIGTIQNLFGGLRIRPVESVNLATRSVARPNIDAQIDLRRAQSSLVSLFKSLERLAEQADIKTRVKLDLPDARSRSALGLDLTTTAASLNSSGEINSAPNSFDPFGPAWTNGSSALVTIGGEYDGSNGSGAFGLEVQRAGTRGSDNLRIRFETPDGSRIQDFNIQSNDPIDQQYDLQNGLYFTLGAGDLINSDFATLNLYAGVGAAVDPTKPLGGTRNDNPNFEFGGPTIVDGQFSIYSETISVSVNDSLNDIVDRINQSAAGVTASFNSLTEQVELLQNTAGATPTIDLQGDTSNFLEAAKLDNLNLVSGIDPETIQTLENVARFSSVQSGDILINGQSTSIDPTADSLTTVIDKINASSAGVVASFDETSQRVTIEALDGNSTLEIDDNATGFFAALDIPEGRVDQKVASGGISKQRSYRVADALTDVLEELNYLFQNSSFIGGGNNAGSFRSPLEAAVKVAFSGSLDDGLYGIKFDLGSTAREFGGFAELDRREFTSSLQRRGDDVIGVLGPGERDGGLVDRLMRGTLDALRRVGSQLGQSGTFIDTFV